MCGLFASIGLPPDEQRIDLVAHRGPDGRGWQVFDSPAGPVALGHRRLAILDLSAAGLQPMHDSGGRSAIVFNGEIYNFIELRAALEAEGETFLTRTDTEVLLALHRRHGAAMLERLRGMFAFAIWDFERRELFVARDPFGIKPLYLARTPSGFALASEIKQLLGLPGVAPRLNAARAGDFLAYGVLDHTPETLFSGVEQLRGGEALTVSTAGGRLAVHRWRFHDLDPQPASRLSLEEACEEFGARLAESIALHLRSDVRVGSCLSGGLDSSAIVSLASGHGPVETVSAVYPGEAVDESRYVDAVAASMGSRSHRVFPRAEDVVDKIDAITWHQDEPFGSTSIIAQFLVFAEAKRVGLPVMLDGQGADEPLGGYASAWPFHHARLLQHGRIGSFAASLRARRAQGASPAGETARALLALLPARIGGLAVPRPGRAGRRPSWLEEGEGQARDMRELAGMAAERLGLPPPADLASHCRLLTYAMNLPMLLHWEDRSSMAHSIEARVPFLDPPLVAFALGLGDEHRIGDGETKRVLRRAMAGRLPAMVLDRRDKIGFATPEASWTKGALRDFVHEGIEDCIDLFPALVRPAELRRARDRAFSGRIDFSFAFWRVASLGRWGRVFGVSG